MSLYEDPVLAACTLESSQLGLCSSPLPQLPHSSLKSDWAAESRAGGWSWGSGVGDGRWDEGPMGFHLEPWGTVGPVYIPPCSFLIHCWIGGSHGDT